MRHQLWSSALFGVIALVVSLGATTPVFAEGSAQAGIGQRLYDYDALTPQLIQQEHPFGVDILAAGEVINVSLCGESDTDPLRVEIYTPSGALALTESLAGGNVSCTDPFTAPLTNPVRYTTSSTGEHEVRLFNENGLLLERFDISVTPDATTNPDPTATAGRVHATIMPFNAGSFAQSDSTDADFFILVPGGFPGTNYVWVLDLNQFAGFIFDLTANTLGVDAPNSGLSVPIFPEPGVINTVTPKFPLYFSYPQVAGPPPSIAPSLNNWRFIDDADQDSGFTPGQTPGVQDTGFFEFQTDISSGTYAITIDTTDGSGGGPDGVFGAGDTLLLGETVLGLNRVSWDGRDNDGTLLDPGTYDAQVQVRIGEYHFVASDAETSGGTVPGSGLTIRQALSDTMQIDTLVYYDDTRLPGGTSTLPNGALSSSIEGRHTWGDFTSETLGNLNLLDTYTFGFPVNSTGLTVTIEEAVLDVSKSASDPVNNGDGSHDQAFTISLTNSGNVDLDGIQVVDDLAAAFPGVDSVIVLGLSSDVFSVNTAFDGVGDTNLLTGLDSLAVGASGTITLDVRVTPGANVGPFENSAVGQGVSPEGSLIDNPGNSGPITFEETADLTVEKTASQPIANSDGTFNVTFTIDVTNTGIADLSNLTITEDLGATFPGVDAVEVVSLTSSSLTTNPNFDGFSDTQLLGGSDALPMGANGIVALELLVTPGDSLGPFTNSVFASGTTPMGVVVPGDGSTPPFGFTEMPQIGLAKGVTDGPTIVGPLDQRVVYLITVENSGDVVLNGIQVTDDLSASFSDASTFEVDAVSSAEFSVNPAFNGVSDQNLLLGTDSLEAGVTATIELIVTVTISSDMVTFSNSATGSGTSPAGTFVMDVSTAGFDPDPGGDGDPGDDDDDTDIPVIPPGSLVIVSKSTSVTEVQPGGLVPYSIRAENTQTMPLASIEITDDIPAGFTFVVGSGRLVRAGADGALGTSDDIVSAISVSGTDPLIFDAIMFAAMEVIELRYVLRVGAGVIPGTYRNLAVPTASGMPVGNVGTAAIEVIQDSQFERTTVIGKVFNDINGDGWQDNGESGIPGVRLATVTGLIVETDSRGRYHIADVDGGLIERGRNFILKLDPVTLPEGTTFSTENPRVLRMTGGLMSQINFGVQLPEQPAVKKQFTVKFSEIFFASASDEVDEAFMPLIDQLADRLERQGGGRIVIEGNADRSEKTYTLSPHFDIRKTSLRSGDRLELDRIVDEWRGATQIFVEAVGHTDSTPIAPQNRREFQNNYVLSEGRARAVGNYIANALGVSEDDMRVIGKGPDYPVADNATAIGREMNRRVELTVSGFRFKERFFSWGKPGVPEDLSVRRARRVYELLKERLGDRIVDKTEIMLRYVPPTDERLSRNNERPARDTTFARFMGAALQVLVPSANAEEIPCTLDECRTEDGYVVTIVDHGTDRAPAEGDSERAKNDNRRVDISGAFTKELADGGTLWITEDPSFAGPRLAVSGPEKLPMKDGRIDGTGWFAAYSNYPVFIAGLEVVLYRADDFDRVVPVATIPVPVGSLQFAPWNGVGDLETLTPGTDLVYKLRAYGKDGHIDETIEKKLCLVSTGEIDAESAPGYDPTGKLRSPGTSAPGLGNAILSITPGSRDTRAYSLTPQFGIREVTLRDDDKAAIDSIVSEWQGVSNIFVEAIGHTDSTPIAAANQTEFKDNFALSRARAAEVAKYLQEKLSLSDDQLHTAGHGPNEPVASNATRAGQQANRRVEVRISGDRIIEPSRVLLIDPATGSEEVLDKERLEEYIARSSDKAAREEHVADGPMAGVFGGNDLAKQTIPINTSRVRLHGSGIGDSYVLRVNNDVLPVDTEGEFAVEYLLPPGTHQLDVTLTDVNGEVWERGSFTKEVTGKYMFFVGLADFTASGSDISGNLEALAVDDRYSDDFLVEGRLAFYLKGRIKGKYLVTAQMDTQEEELGDLFSNIFDKDPDSIFRRLDPDRYYPVYGDDSTTYSDTDSQGGLYVRVDWNESEARWGNFHTGITGNEFAQYNRSLYGGKLHSKSKDTTDIGDNRTDASVFVSEVQTALGHAEFLGTGGSLYYLKHTDILPGSEKVRVEIRERDTNRVVENETLRRGVDYEVDEIQGRIILSRPLSQVSQQYAPSIIKDEPLDGNDVLLLVDYEYAPDRFDTDKVTAGARAKHWFNDRVAVGGTYVDENRAGDDYSLAGADVTLQAGKGTYLKVEYAESESQQANRFYSDNGGLTFVEEPIATAAATEGEAFAVEARANLRALGRTERDWVGAAWYRDRDAGFSAARRDEGVASEEYGAELTGEIGDRLRLSARASVIDEELRGEETKVGVQADYRLKRGEIAGEVRQDSFKPVAGPSQDITLAAMRYTRRLNDKTDVYAAGQVTVDEDSFTTENDLATIGVRVRASERTNLTAEYSDGDRGTGATLAMDHRINPNHTLFGTLTHSTDRSDPFSNNQFALGHRSRLSDQAQVFNETQFSRGRDESGIAHVFGVDLNTRSGWKVGMSLQHGELDARSGRVDRDAATLSFGWENIKVRFATKLEYRNDEGSENREQLLTTNRLDWKVSDSLRVMIRNNWSSTDASGSGIDDAKFIENGIGFAYRPVNNDRLNLLGSYQMLYDLRGIEQLNAGMDQRSSVYSLEGIYRLNQRWKIGGKIAARESELREARDDGQWFENSARFLALRTRIHIIKRWDGLIEYRMLDVDETDSMRDGLLLAIDRHFGEHLKLGIGYNFTDFSDDLTDLDYDNQGWFFNALGKY